MALWLLGTLFEHGIDGSLRQTDNDLYVVWNDLFDGAINAELLILGSSRAWVQIDPALLDTALDVDSYNLGLDGYPFDMQYALFQEYVRYNAPPRYIIQTLDILTLRRRANLFNREQFLPYLASPTIYKTARSYGLHPFDRYVPMFKYYGSPIALRVGLLELLNLKHYRSNKYKGFRGLDKAWDTSFEQFRQANPSVTIPIADALLEDIIAFVDYCRNHNITLIFVYPPEYIEYQALVSNRKQIFDIYTTIARDYHIPFLDYSDSFFSQTTDHFYNSQHLHANGARLFTRSLADDIKRLLQARDAQPYQGE